VAHSRDEWWSEAALDLRQILWCELRQVEKSRSPLAAKGQCFLTFPAAVVEGASRKAVRHTGLQDPEPAREWHGLQAAGGGLEQEGRTGLTMSGDGLVHSPASNANLMVLGTKRDLHECRRGETLSREEA
jgi:hypothetical protein